MKTKIESLQTMRLFASLGVFQYHLWNNYLGVLILHPGTDFFLVLVGVVAAYSQARQIPEKGWWKYIRSRYTRLYVTFIPAFLLTLLVKRDEVTLDYTLRSFFLLPISEKFPLIGATWMLSMFLLFYFLFSLAFLFRREWVLAAVFAAWTYGIVAFNWLGWLPPLPKPWLALIFNERNLEFVMGYLAGIMLRQDRVKPILGQVLLWTGLVGLVAATVFLFRGFTPARSFVYGIPVTLFILGLASLEQHQSRNILVRGLTWPGLVWLGGASYVLYITHGIFLQGWNRFLPVTPVLVPIITLGGLAAAGLVYQLWEKPVLAWVQRRLKLSESSGQLLRRSTSRWSKLSVQRTSDTPRISKPKP